MDAINSYDGPGFVGAGAVRPPRRDGVKLTHREVMRQFVLLGNNALNASDFERTMHLPVGKGRLACDPETGEFDKDAPRPTYNSASQPEFPRHVHSTITEGEYKTVNNMQEYEDALATRKWARMPLERKKRFTLTAEDQMLNLKAQLEGERAARLDMEKRVEAGIYGSSPDSKEAASVLAMELQQEREARKALEDRVNALLSRLESKPKPDEDEDKDEEAAVTTGKAARSSRR